MDKKLIYVVKHSKTVNERNDYSENFYTFATLSRY